MPILAAPAFFGNLFLELFAFRPCLIHKNYDRMCPYSKQEYKGGDRDGNNQKQGIGTRLLKAVMEKYESVYQMELLTDDRVIEGKIFPVYVCQKVQDRLGLRMVEGYAFRAVNPVFR